MSTHRRGVRPSQWPVRDLLGPETVRTRFWDARVGAAAAGLLACGAAVTVVLSSGSRAVSDQPLEAPGSPLAIPAPAPPVPEGPPPVAPPQPAPPRVAEPRLPARAVAPRPRSARPQHRRAAPRHRTAVPAPSARHGPVEAGVAPQDPTLAEQVATAIDGWEARTGPDRTVVGWLLVPVQGPADAAALLDAACVDEARHERRSGARHRARDRDAEQRADRRHEARGGRHRAPDPHREDRGGRHRHEGDRTVHDATHGHERTGRAASSLVDPDERGPPSGDVRRDASAVTRRRSGLETTVLLMTTGPSRGSDDDRVSDDDRASARDHASGDDWDWFSAA